MLVLPDSIKEPVQKVKLPILVAAAAAGTKKKRGTQVLNPAAVNPDCVNPEQVTVEGPSVTEGEQVVSTLNKNAEID